MSVRTTFTAQGCHSYVGRHSTLPYSAIPFVAGSTKAPAQASRYDNLPCTQLLQNYTSIRLFVASVQTLNAYSLLTQDS